MCSELTADLGEQGLLQVGIEFIITLLNNLLITVTLLDFGHSGVGNSVSTEINFESRVEMDSPIKERTILRKYNCSNEFLTEGL